MRRPRADGLFDRIATFGALCAAASRAALGKRRGSVPAATCSRPFERRRGLPIGNLTSQLFANVYLDRFDHFVTDVLRAPYLRYVDDFALFADDPAGLAAWRGGLAAFLARRRLSLHPVKTHVGGDVVAGGVPRVRAAARASSAAGGERAAVARGAEGLFQTVDPAGRRLTGRAPERRLVLAMIKRRGRGGGAAALNVLPHVPGDGDHGVPCRTGGRSSARIRSRGTHRRRRRSSNDRTADTVTVDEIERIVI